MKGCGTAHSVGWAKPTPEPENHENFRDMLVTGSPGACDKTGCGVGWAKPTPEPEYHEISRDMLVGGYDKTGRGLGWAKPTPEPENHENFRDMLVTGSWGVTWEHMGKIGYSHKKL